jgi:hypothetical protein
MKLTLLLVIVGIGGAAPGSSPGEVEEEWTVSFSGGHEKSSGNKIAVDASGDVYVTGRSGSTDNDDIATVKYGPDGAEKWARLFDGPGKAADEGIDIGLDASGNVYVCGSRSTTRYLACAAVIKYDPDGNFLWIATSGGMDTSDSPVAMAVEASGRAYITASSTDTNGFENGSWTLALDLDGGMLWKAVYPRGITQGLTIDGEGNVYVTGQMVPVGASPGAWVARTVKYASDGRELWSSSSRLVLSIARAIAVDGDGNSYVTGDVGNDPMGNDCITIGYDRNGKERWVARYAGPAGGDSGRCIRLDPDGNICVGGITARAGSGTDYMVLKYSTSGVLLWFNPYSGTGEGEDELRAMAVDRAGSVLVTGRSVNGPTSTAFVTVKFGNDGDLLWTASMGGSEGTFDMGMGIAVDPSGGAYVTGQALLDGAYRILTAKYAAPGPDCNGNGVGDPEDIARGTSRDCDGNGIPDECDIASGAAKDCNGNGIPDACDIAGGLSKDVKGGGPDGVPDECQPTLFHRGDTNGDGEVDISDGLCLLESLFTGGGCLGSPGGGRAAGCLEAADGNDDGTVDCSDPVFVLGWLFLGSRPPPPPGPSPVPCGPDPEPPGSPDTLGCDSYPACE